MAISLITGCLNSLGVRSWPEAVAWSFSGHAFSEALFTLWGRRAGPRSLTWFARYVPTKFAVSSLGWVAWLATAFANLGLILTSCLYSSHLSRQSSLEFLRDAYEAYDQTPHLSCEAGILPWTLFANASLVDKSCRQTQHDGKMCHASGPLPERTTCANAALILQRSSHVYLLCRLQETFNSESKVVPIRGCCNSGMLQVRCNASCEESSTGLFILSGALLELIVA